MQLETLTGEDIPTEGEVDITLDNIGCQKFVVIPAMGNEAVLGQDFCDKFGVNLDFRRQTVYVGSRKFPMKYESITNIPKIHKIQEVTAVPEFMTGIDQHDVFREGLGYCTATEPLTIDTEGPPIKSRPYRQALTKRKLVEDHIDEMLANGVIRPSRSPWSSPVTLVPKGTETRFCVDYRRVNAQTIKDCYPLPNIQAIFDSLAGAKIFTTLDLRSGYHQVPLSEESIPKSAFVCHKGLFEFVRAPFGLTNLPAQFQRLMNKILSKYIGKTCLVFLDDIIVFSKTEQEHVQHVREILETIHAANLTLKLKKCSFGQRKVDLLGYVVSEKGISPQESKISAIRDLPNPKTVKEIRSFLGMSGYYRQCIEGYADIAQPLVELTKKRELFRWGEEQQKAFDSLKGALCSNSVLKYPDPTQAYRLYTDASAYAAGSILVQLDDQGIERPIHYVSKQLTDTQRRWSAIEREAYAIIYSLTKLRCYLHGADFTIYTDHKPLKSLFFAEIQNSRVQRWAMLISEFGCKIEYRQGKHQVRADMLSRVRIETVNQILREGHTGKEQQEAFADEWTKAELEDSSDYVIDNGELFSVRLPYLNAQAYPRLMLPPSQREKVIREAHIETGHRSKYATLRRIQSFCVWEGMAADIKAFIEQCPTCQANARNLPRTRLQITDTPTKPFEKLGIDLIGPLLPSKSNNRYILTVICHLTGWAEAYAIPDKTSRSVWNALYTQFFSRYGFPQCIVTDCGKEMTSCDIRTNFGALGIEHRQTTPGNPRSNGVTERFNQTLKGTLRKLVNNNTSEWETQLAEALLAYRMSENQGRNSSPFYAIFGFECNVDTLFNSGEHRFENLARAHRDIYQKQIEAKQYRQKIGPQSSREVKVGEYVTIDQAEPVTLSHLRDHCFRVVSSRGKVIGYVPINPRGAGPDKPRYINVDRCRVVPANITWSDLNPRPRRYRGPSDIRTLNQGDRDQEYELAPPQHGNPATSIRLIRRPKYRGRNQPLSRKRQAPRAPEAAKRLRIGYSLRY